jgi:RimJ/RimL family protein N-acetyltransferase
MTALFETERLRLRHFTANDVNNLLQLTSDAEVMRYIGDGATDDREAAKNRLTRFMSHYEKYPGLGFWAAEQKSKNKFIGWFALKYIPKSVEVEIGYLFRKPAWGKGFATEGARAMLAYGFNHVGLNRIVAVANIDNKASQNVMKKIGMRDCGIAHYYDRDVAYFAADCFDFAKPKA